MIAIRSTFHAVVVTFLFTTTVLVATSESSYGDDVDPSKPANTEAPATGPTSETGEDEGTDPLLRKLIGEAIDDAEGDAPLAAAAEMMERAARRIGESRDSGIETRGLQKRAIDDLDALIELARQQQAGRQSSPSGGPPMPMPPGDQPEGMPGEGGMEEGTGSAAGEDGPRRDDGEASESTEATAAARDRKAALAERRRLVKDVWGHLPPTMREELLNAYSDRALPKYEELVRAYFRALAERTNDDEN